MTTIESPPPPTVPPAAQEPVNAAILANARALAPWLRSQGDRIEATRRLPDDVVRGAPGRGDVPSACPRTGAGPS